MFGSVCVCDDLLPSCEYGRRGRERREGRRDAVCAASVQSFPFQILMRTSCPVSHFHVVWTIFCVHRVTWYIHTAPPYGPLPSVYGICPVLYWRHPWHVAEVAWVDVTAL
jgi:hypothetical protein